MFCNVKGYEALGYAKVIDVNDSKITVEYFDSPANVSRHTNQVPKSQIIQKKLGGNTRVYFFIESSGTWLVGRVKEDLGDGLDVRFPGMKDMFLGYKNVFVRWKKPITNPIDYLGKLITETPQYAEDRSGFLSTYIAQRRATWGISALLSSVIELEPHQVNVVRKILSDPSQRYMLADEVGLGKTIEAGVVIRQAVLDSPWNHRIIVLVPIVLVEQWRQELIQRFGLIDFVDESVLVVSHEDELSRIDLLLQNASLLVIDEAHHIASLSNNQLLKDLYDRVKLHGPKIEKILLLSATPILRNEAGFLRMLHLLDPVVYDIADEQSFREKINHRQILAESVAMLDPQNALYLDNVLDELLDKLPDDERLCDLIVSLREQLIGIPDEDNPDLNEAIRLLRAHLSETYRLHRRILRNRRKRVKGLTPNRSDGREIIVRESQFEQVEDLLEAWRISATAEDSSHANELVREARINFFWDLVNAILTDPGDIKGLCKLREKEILTKPEFSFKDEAKLLKELAELLDHGQWLQDRLDHLANEIPLLLHGRTKIVIFITKAIIADAVFERLRLFLHYSVVRHRIINNNELDTNEYLWTAFNNNDAVKVIVCDQSAEEGINLQGGNKLVIHFDLPLEPNRIEQRMGRVDRYGSGDPVASYVIRDISSKYQRSWYCVLDDALGVFKRSISSLQYLIDEQLRLLRPMLFQEGLEAIDDLKNKLRGQGGAVEQELILIDQQDSLDELSPLFENDLDELYDVDDNWKDIKKNTCNWAINSLMFGEIIEDNQGVDPPFRFQYRVPGRGGPATLISLNSLIDDFLGTLDYDNPHSTSSRPLSYPHSLRRQTAIKRGTRLLRYGDEFVESLKAFSDMDDRGRSYMIWRQFYEDASLQGIRMFFRFDFLIETRLDDAMKVFTKNSTKQTNSSRSAISRRGDALFAPFVKQIWVDEEGEEPHPDFVSHYLSAAYAKHGVPERYIDTNLKPARLIPLTELMSDTFANWEERCGRMRVCASKIVLEKREILTAQTTALNRARVEDEIREAQLRTRIRALGGKEAKAESTQFNLEKTLNAALYKGIETPSIKTDVAGVVILTSMPFSLSK
ncbi:DEAD/DEAH box helicase [Candidatus Parcubacteria bacterium]|nr:MAG: DEAD/DEAH box helicase [Candidatus Parcubacteria bacterium]